MLGVVEMDIDQKEIATSIATDLIKSGIQSGWDKIRSYFKDLGAELDIEYRTAYTDYLNNTRDRYSKIKTIIYRRERKDLYSFYESTDISHSGKRVTTSDINNLLNVDSKLLVTGTGGIGKSILFKHLFLNSLENTDHIPIFIELRSLNNLDNKEVIISDLVYKTLYYNGFKLEKQYFERSLELGAYIVFLDGFDEIHHDKRDIVTEEIKNFCQKYYQNHVFVSSRPSAEFIGWSDFSEVESLPLTKAQALSLIDKIEFDEKVKATFYEELDKNLFDKYTSFASNPLLLTIMLLTFQKHASIPERLNDFYEEAFVTLFNVHDATKDSFVRDIRSDLGCEDFKLIFSYICFKSYFSGEYEFSETRLHELIGQAKDKFKDKIQFNVNDFQDDLVHSVCMLVKEGLEYRFSHRSFQEYFAAWYTCKIPDAMQVKLLNQWIRESVTLESDSYFKMLYDLQNEKVNSVILYPGISEIATIYKELGYSKELLLRFFSAFRLYKNNETGKINSRLTIRGGYLPRVFLILASLNNIQTIKNDEYVAESDYELFTSSETRLGYLPSIDKGIEVFGDDRFKEIFSWIKVYFDTIVSVEEKSRNSTTNKRKVSTILDEL